MKYPFLLILFCTLLVSCGKRGTLRPSEPDQYPHEYPRTQVYPNQ